MPLQVFCRNCAKYRREWCNLKVDSPDPDLMRDCQYYRGMTNADKIRAMSDEELARFMNHGACPPGKDVSELCCDEDGGSVPDMCNLCWFEWLQQEVE